jgi:cell division transport system permease protein
MIGALLLPRQFRLDLPLRQDASGRFLPWIIALMVYLAAVGGVALIWLGDTLAEWNATLASALTLQLPADTSEARIEMALGALRQTKGVLSAHLLAPAETAKLLEPWLGKTVPIDTLPLPHLVDVRVNPAVAIDYETLRRQLDSIVPNSQLDNNRAWLAGVRDFAVRLEGLITGGVVVVTILIVAIIIFTARIGLAIHRSVIELLHLLGAQDSYIARQFQVHALGLGLRGGIIGGIAAVVTVLIVGPAGHAFALPVPVATYGILDWRLWVLLVVTGIAAGGVAMLTARITVLRQLARMP